MLNILMITIFSKAGTDYNFFNRSVTKN